MPSMDQFSANEIQRLTREYLLDTDFRPWEIAIQRGQFQRLLSHLAAKGHLDSTDVRMVAILTLLGPGTIEAAPQELRDWLLERIETPHPNAPPPMDRVRDHAIVLGTAGGEGAWKQPVHAGPWGWGNHWGNARECLISLLASPVTWVDSTLERYFPGAPRPQLRGGNDDGAGMPCYVPDAPDYLADRLMGLARQLVIPRGSQIEITSRAGETLFDVASERSALADGESISFLSRTWAVYKSGARLGFEAGQSVHVVLLPGPVRLQTGDPILSIWPGERIRFTGPCSLLFPSPRREVKVPKDHVLEIRPNEASLEVWRLESHRPLLPAVRRVFEVASNSCRLCNPQGWVHIVEHGEKIRVEDCKLCGREGWIHVVERGQSMVVLGQDEGFEVAVNQGKVKSPGDGDTVMAIGPCQLSEAPCPCGWVHCRARHRISAWAPYQATDTYVALENFLYSTVKGTLVEQEPAGAPIPLAAKAFEKSMYYPVLASLADGVRFRIAPVERKICGSCHEGFVYGAVCACGEVFDPETMRRKTEDWIIPVGVDPAIFIAEGRVHCNYSKAVWVPAKLHRYSLADMAKQKLLNDPMCNRCGELLNEFGVRVEREVKGKKVKFIEKCGKCGNDLEPLSQKTYRCDNFYTISEKQFERHGQCGGTKTHNLSLQATRSAAAGNGAAGLAEVLAAARKFDESRARVRQCPECGTEIRPLAWCPCCSALGLEPVADLPMRIYQVWVPTNNQAVQLGAAVAFAQPQVQNPAPNDDIDG